MQSGNLSGFIVKLYQPFDHYFVLQLFRTRIITVADVKSDRAMSNRFFWQQRRTTAKSDERTAQRRRRLGSNSRCLSRSHFHNIPDRLNKKYLAMIQQMKKLRRKSYKLFCIFICTIKHFYLKVMGWRNQLSIKSRIQTQVLITKLSLSNTF